MTGANDVMTRAAWTILTMAAMALLVFLRGEAVLTDPDTQWHIATGRLIMETGALPLVDTMSHTHAGQPWIAKEWLSQLLLYAAYALGGWTAVTAQTALCVAAAAGIVAWRLFRVLPPLAALLLLWVAMLSLLPIACARPHALALPVMALFAAMLLRATERDGEPPWLALPVLALWANLHAAFTLGFLVAACIGLDALLRAAPERRMRVFLLWGLFGLGCLAAACAHPYGLQPLLINVDMARGNESIPMISEWDRHTIFGEGGFRILVPAALVALIAPRWRTEGGRLLLGCLALYLTWRHQRFIMLLAVVAPMLSRDAVAAALRAVGARVMLFAAGDPLRDPKWRAPTGIAALACFAALPFAAGTPAPAGSVAPLAALNAVPPEIRAQPVYNSYNLGGFLVLNRVPTFMDGRTDQLFSSNFIARYHAHTKAGDAQAFLAFVDAYGPRWAIVQKGERDLPLIEGSPLWREIYSDRNAKVFVRAGG